MRGIIVSARIVGMMLLLLYCSMTNAAELKIIAAAALSDVFNELGPKFRT